MSNKENTLQALIFDVDGTLADTERDGHRPAFNTAFADAGLDWHWDVELYGKLLAVTGGKERMKYYLQSFNTGFSYKGDLDALIAGLHRAKTTHYLALLREGKIPLRPGVERLLAEARERGLRLGIATTTTPENVTGLLTATLGEESLDWFEVIAAGDIVPEKKPAPDIYNYALGKMGLPANSCLAFEDSRNGFKSSLAADLATVVTVNGYTAEDDFSGAAIVLDQFGEIDNPARVIAGEAVDTRVLDIDAINRIWESLNIDS